MRLKNYLIALVSMFLSMALIFLFIDQSAADISVTDGASIISMLSLLYLVYLSKGVYSLFTNSIERRFLKPLTFFISSRQICLNPWHVAMLISTGSIIPFALLKGVSLQDAVGVFGAAVLHYYLIMYLLNVLNHFFEKTTFNKTVDAIFATGLLFMVLTDYFGYSVLQLANPFGAMFYFPIAFTGNPDLMSWIASIVMSATLIVATYSLIKRNRPNLFA